MKTVIVIPTYNEKENIGPLLEKIFTLLPEVFILVVDDNSPDKTAETVREKQKKFSHLFLLVREKKEGLGKAYVDAFSRVIKDSEVDKVVMMDADFSHDPERLPAFLAAAAQSDIVVGSRYVKGGGTVGWELWRRILSRFGNFYARLITGMPLADLTGGFNLMAADFLRRINLEGLDMSGYAFIMEIKSSLFIAGAKFYEVPIIFRNRREGESKISSHIIREGVIAPWKIRAKINKSRRLKNK
jgi:dolichol-phosphate mannosyltransferase